jgi:hypothetical protein
LDNEAIIGDVRTTEQSSSKDPAVRIPRVYKIMFAIQLVCLLVVAGLAYSVV